MAITDTEGNQMATTTETTVNLAFLGPRRTVRMPSVPGGRGSQVYCLKWFTEPGYGPAGFVPIRKVVQARQDKRRRVFVSRLIPEMVTSMRLVQTPFVEGGAVAPTEPADRPFLARLAWAER
jgi:hypothetical protein